MGIRNYPDIPRVYIDMDGTAMDYEGLAKKLNVNPKYLKLMSGAYEVMSPMERAKEAIALFKSSGYDTWFLTKCPSENPSSASEKLRSVWRHFPEIGDQVIITPDKGAVGTSRDILIDDHPEWANANSFPGKIISFKSWDQAMHEFNRISQVATP